jgi:hypothetical protein
LLHLAADSKKNTFAEVIGALTPIVSGHFS